MTTLTKRIMRRIYVIYVLRRLTARRAVAFYALVISGAAIFAAVSVSNVLANMPSLFELGAMSEFLVAALLNTEVLVQLLVFAALIALIVFAFDVIKGSRSEHSYA